MAFRLVASRCHREPSEFSCCVEIRAIERGNPFASDQSDSSDRARPVRARSSWEELVPSVGVLYACRTRLQTDDASIRSMWPVSIPFGNDSKPPNCKIAQSSHAAWLD